MGRSRVGRTRGWAWALAAGVIVVSSCGAASSTASPPGSVDPASTSQPGSASDQGDVGEGDGADPAGQAAPPTLPLYDAGASAPETTATTGTSETLDEPLRPVEPDAVRVLPATVPSAGGGTDDTVTVTDASRILPLWGNLAEIVYSLGLGDQVVGRDTSATFAEAAHLPVVTRGHDVSAESVLSLRPTVVLAQTDTGPPEALEQIRSAGVPIVVVDTPTSIDDAVGRIDLIARALGVPAAGDALAERTAAEIDAARAEVPAGDTPPRIAFLYMRGAAGVYLLGGPGSGADSMIAAAGGVDAGTEYGLDRAFTPLTSEALVAIAPDVVLLTTTGLESVGGIDGLVEIPGVAQTPAGRDRRVITVEDGLLYSFGARTPLALGEIVRQLHATAS